MSFIAKWGSTCGFCDQRIRPGEEVAYTAFGDLGHVKCPADPTELQRAVCPECFLEVPVTGVCESCNG